MKIHAVRGEEFVDHVVRFWLKRQERPITVRVISAQNLRNSCIVRNFNVLNGGAIFTDMIEHYYILPSGVSYRDLDSSTDSATR